VPGSFTVLPQVKSYIPLSVRHYRAHEVRAYIPFWVGWYRPREVRAYFPLWVGQYRGPALDDTPIAEDAPSKRSENLSYSPSSSDSASCRFDTCANQKQSSHLSGEP
jgi:hypothetical protein